MAQPCKICNHPNRSTIEEALKANIQSLNAIAKQWGLTQPSVARHKYKHMDPAEIQEASLGAIQSGHSITIKPIPDIPEDYKPKPGQINAYQDMLYLRDKAVALLEHVESKVDEDGSPVISTTEMSIAMRELRETTKTMVQVYETQKRIEAEYSPPETVTGSFIYRFLKERYPGVLMELAAAVKKEADQGQAD